MSDPVIRFEVEGSVALIELNRPEALNTFDKAMYRDFNVAIRRFAEDDRLFVAVIAAAGDRAFSAGVDLKALDRDMKAGGMEGYGIVEIADEMVTSKPIIAAVHGHCVGEGLNVALACDLIVAEETARFSVPEPKVGVAAVDIPLKLAKKVGYGAAFSLLVPGEPRDVDWMQGAGLVHARAPAGEVRDVAMALATRIANEAGPLAIRATKETLWRAVFEDQATARKAGLEWRDRILTSEDFAEGRRAFLEKREPRFKGN